MSTRREFLKLAGAAATVSLSGRALAEENPFGFKNVQNSEANTLAEMNCGEGKCGANNRQPKQSQEGHCGGKTPPKDQEGRCGDNRQQKPPQEGHCGGNSPSKTQEGRCGDNRQQKPPQEGHCGGNSSPKTQEGRCGDNR